MADSVALPAPESTPIPAPIPVRQLLPWAVFGLLLAVAAIYFVSTEQGAATLVSGQWVHEFAHDSRHMLGFPCH